MPQEFKYREILETLNRFDVEYIVVGGVCAVIHGAPVSTFEVDVLYRIDEQNLDRIEAALAALQAYHREPGDRKLAPQRRVLVTGGPALFTTSLGALDFVGRLDVKTYEDLLPTTSEVEISGGLRFRVLDLERLIEAKEAAGRPKDLMVLPILRETLRERERLG